jgi:hypothetical protein
MMLKFYEMPSPDFWEGARDLGRLSIPHRNKIVLNKI